MFSIREDLIADGLIRPAVSVFPPLSLSRLLPPPRWDNPLTVWDAPVCVWPPPSKEPL